MMTTRNNIVVLSCIAVVLVQLCHSSPVFVPQFLSGGTGRNIRHLPCVSRRTGEQGVCMFAFTCAKANGTHLGTCIDRFYFGSCCKIDDPSTAIDVFPQDNAIDTDNTSPAKPFVITSSSSSSTTTTTTTTTSSTTNQPFESNDIPGNVDNKLKTRPTKRPTPPPSVDATTQSTRLSTFQTVQNNASQQRYTTLPTTSANTKISAATPRPTSTTAFYLTTSSSVGSSKKPTPPATTFGQRISTKKPAAPSTAFTKKPVPATGPTSSSSSSSSSSLTTSSTKLHRNVTSTVTDRPSLITTTTQRTYPATRFPPRNATTISSTKISSYATTTTKNAVPETTFKPTITKKPVKTSSKRPTTTSTTVTKKPTTTVTSKKPVTTASTPVVTKAATTTISPLTSVKATTPTTVTSTKKIVTKKPTTTSSSTLAVTKKPVTNATYVTKKPLTTSTIVTKKPVTTTTTTVVTKKPVTTTTSAVTTTPAPRTTTTTSRPVTTTPSTTRRPTTATTLKRTTTTPPPVRLTTTSAPTTTTSQPSTLTFTTSTTTTTTTSKPTRLPVATTAKPTVAVTKPTAKLTTTTSSTTTTAKPPTKNATISNEIDAEFDEQTPPGLVTWSSFPDESPTKAPTKEPDTTETEWQPITTPDGWIIIQSPTTEQEESEVEEEEAKPVSSSSSSSSSSSTTSSSSTATPTTTTTTTITASKPTTTATTTTTTTTTRSTTESTAATTQRVITTQPTTYVDMLSTLASVTLAPDFIQPPAAPLNMSNYKDVCGRRLFPESRIVGGDSSTFGKWPWQISLRQWRTSTYLHKCGAALLNENWAITAAHCVQNVLPSDLLLRIGEHDLGNEDEPYGFQERRVQIVASHPNFDPRTFEFDLALMRFYEPVLPFQPNVLPICIPDDDEDYVGQTAFVTGWGRLYEDGPLPSVLQEVAVPVINNSVCENMYRNAGYIEHIPHIFICAGWRKGGFDSCEGDSGGPLVIQRKRDKRWILAGVISWGIGCAEPNQPGVYTRISEFREWINQILQF